MLFHRGCLYTGNSKIKKLFSFILISKFNKYETSKAITIPNTYNPINTIPLRLKKPKKFLSGIINDVKIVNTGKRALQLINGVTKMVNNLSFLFSIFLALMIAGTAQAKPPIIGITLFPFNPTRRIILSDKKLIRAMYPVSSSNVIRPNNIMI